MFQRRRHRVGGALGSHPPLPHKVSTPCANVKFEGTCAPPIDAGCHMRANVAAFAEVKAKGATRWLLANPQLC